MNRALSPFLHRLLRRTLLTLFMGAGIGGLALGWGVQSCGKGALVGLAYVLPMEGGIRLFRAWRVNAEAASHPDRVGLLFVVKLLVIWAGSMAVVLPIAHWGLGLPVLKSPGHALPHLAFSLTGAAILLVADTANQLVRTGAALARSEARAEFLALKAQLQPHTLFNALNGIAGLARDNPKAAEEGARRLARLMRRVLQGLDQTSWTLAEEFELLGDLLGLESLRFGERLHSELVLDPAMAPREVPPLLLLPLVENSLKHGFRRQVGPCSIRVVAAKGRLSVIDDGCGMPTSWVEGVGLKTVRERTEAEGGTFRVVPETVGSHFAIELP